MIGLPCGEEIVTVC